MNHLVKRIVLSVMTVAVIGFSAPLVHAAEGESIAMSPTSKRYSLDPGTDVKDSVRVINDGTDPYTVSMYARPYSVDGEDYKPVFSKLSPQTDAYSWVQFEQTSYTLQPGETVEVPYTIKVPANADSGGHYGVIFAETQPANADGSVVRKKRVGAIIYATVKGDNTSEGVVDSTKISFLQTNPPLTAVSKVKNGGNVDFVDSTSMVVKDLFGKEKFADKRDLAVLPSTTRSIEYNWKDSSLFGLYNVTITHSFLGKDVTTSSLVLMMPIWLMIVVALVIIAAIVYVVMRTKSKQTKKRASKKSSKA